MAKQANRMVIGGFVVISIGIFIVSLIVFGTGKFFKKTELFVLHFEGSVKGLNVGAPVLFQGVQIGSVKSIVIRSYRSEFVVKIPVVIEIEPEKFEIGDNRQVQRTPHESVPKLVELGLRAVLTTQSFITGQLMIECDFYPDSPVVYRDVEKEYLEIPTIRSATERLAQNFQDFDVEGLQNSLKSILTGIDHLVNNPKLMNGIETLESMIVELEVLVRKIQTRIDPLADHLDSTLRNTNTLADNINRHVDPLANEMNKTLKEYRVLAQEANAQLKKVTSDFNTTIVASREVISEDAPMMVELKRTLQEVGNAARSFRQLAEYLEQHPETVLQGKDKTRRD